MTEGSGLPFRQTDELAVGTAAGLARFLLSQASARGAAGTVLATRVGVGGGTLLAIVRAGAAAVARFLPTRARAGRRARSAKTMPAKCKTENG